MYTSVVSYCTNSRKVFFVVVLIRNLISSFCVSSKMKTYFITRLVVTLSLFIGFPMMILSEPLSMYINVGTTILPNGCVESFYFYPKEGETVRVTFTKEEWERKIKQEREAEERDFKKRKMIKEESVLVINPPSGPFWAMGLSVFLIVCVLVTVGCYFIGRKISACKQRKKQKNRK